MKFKLSFFDFNSEEKKLLDLLEENDIDLKNEQLKNWCLQIFKETDEKKEKLKFKHNDYLNEIMSFLYLFLLNENLKKIIELINLKKILTNNENFNFNNLTDFTNQLEISKNIKYFYHDIDFIRKAAPWLNNYYNQDFFSDFFGIEKTYILKLPIKLKKYINLDDLDLLKLIYLINKIEDKELDYALSYLYLIFDKEADKNIISILNFKEIVYDFFDKKSNDIFFKSSDYIEKYKWIKNNFVHLFLYSLIINNAKTRIDNLYSEEIKSLLSNETSLLINENSSLVIKKTSLHLDTTIKIKKILNDRILAFKNLKEEALKIINYFNLDEIFQTIKDLNQKIAEDYNQNLEKLKKNIRR